MNIKPGKHARTISEVKSALDHALSEGVISQKAYDRINIPGLKPKKKTFEWDFEAVPPPPSEPEPEPIPVTVAEYCDAVVVDACGPEVAEGITCAAPPDVVAEPDTVASPADQVEPSSQDETLAEVVSETVDAQRTGMDNKDKEKGFAFTTCFRCGRVDVTQYGDRSLPKEVRGECEVDNGIVMILCGICQEMDGGSNDTESLCLDFKELKLSPELLEGSVVQNIANAVLSQEVAFITDEGGIAYRDINAMATKLRRGDKLMSVDVDRFKGGERQGLILGFLAGGLIRLVKGQKADKGREDEDEWGGLSSKSSKKKKGLFS
jgi:hypothetical protein